MDIANPVFDIRFLTDRHMINSAAAVKPPQFFLYRTLFSFYCKIYLRVYIILKKFFRKTEENNGNNKQKKISNHGRQ